MARYREALCRICRRQGVKLYLKGGKCDTAKCTFERRGFPPGQHGKRRKKISEYGLQLREKQKLRWLYGMMEAQFNLYFKIASRKKGVTGNNLLQLLETRLDNVIYRLGMATGRRAAHQVVQHGHIKVNSKRVNIPSYLVKTGDKIEIVNREKTKIFIKENLEQTAGTPVPDWLEIDKEKVVAKIIHLPERKDINIPVDEHLIVELYSK